MNCELCERPAGEAYLCDGCAADTAERLEQLPELAEELAGLLIPGRQIGGDGRGSRPTEPPTPDLDRIAARYGFAILPSWHLSLFDAPGWPRPTGRLDGLDGRITAACIALRASIEWIVHWPAAGDLAREVKELFADARSLTGGRDLPARMGLCPATYDGVRCGAVLYLPDGQQVVRCAWCNATYPPGVWAALRIEQGKAAAA